MSGADCIRTLLTLLSASGESGCELVFAHRGDMSNICYRLTESEETPFSVD